MALDRVLLNVIVAGVNATACTNAGAPARNQLSSPPMTLPDPPDPGAREWLEADGAGGFASSTVDGIRTRRYHALLLTQTPTGRVVLVNGFEAWVQLPDGTLVAITSQRYAPDVIHPDGAARIAAYTTDPWPTWTYTLPDGSTLTQEVFVAGGQTSLRWTRTGEGSAQLILRPLLSGRDYHALHHENPVFAFAPETGTGYQRWRPYPGLPPVTLWGGTYAHDPAWYRRFLYTQEEARGLDDVEDLASPGRLTWSLDTPATLALRADAAPAWPVPLLAQAEAAERAAHTPLRRAARQYLAAQAGRDTIIAGYPWFTDWGRDTFISLRGLLLSPPSHPLSGGQQQTISPNPADTRARLGHRAQAEANRLEAEKILLAWSRQLDGGMLPNRFSDGTAPPESNAVDASLWFVIAVHDLLALGAGPAATAQLQGACVTIIDAYRAGTKHGIHMDTDALIHAAAPGLQLTWMDAKVGHWVVTPRAGKPVEIQALWINALRIAAAWDRPAYAALADQATATLLDRFPDPLTGGLLDLVDGDPGESSQLRPNQVFTCGGLPHVVVPPSLARRIVDLVEAELLTPLGLRTLAASDPAYHARYRGGPRERDGAYHQGTAWPWLLGPFVEAWLRVRGSTTEAKAEARTRFLPPLHAHLQEAGIGHISEIVDAEPPHTPAGCPFQAWSLAEYLRIEAML